MSAFAKDPWGKRAVSPRPSDQSIPVRRLVLRRADGSAPGVVGPPPPISSGAVMSGAFTQLRDLMHLNDEGDLTGLPDYLRRAPSRFARGAGSATPGEDEKGREGVPSGAFPLPHPRNRGPGERSPP